MAGLYWNEYVSKMLLSCGQSISSLLRGAPSAERKEKKGVSVTRLLSYMLPYSRRFVAVLFLVILSSYGESGRAVDPASPLVCSSLTPRKSSCCPAQRHIWHHIRFCLQVRWLFLSTPAVWLTGSWMKKHQMLSPRPSRSWHSWLWPGELTSIIKS